MKIPTKLFQFIAFRVSIAQDWTVFRAGIGTSWVVARYGVQNTLVFRVGVEQRWATFRVGTVNQIVFRVGIQEEKDLLTLRVQLLPLDDGVLLTLPAYNKDYSLLVKSYTSQDTVPSKEVPSPLSEILEQQWAFISEEDGVYQVIVKDNNDVVIADSIIVVNNKTLMLLDSVRRLILDGDCCDLREYEMLLALNYTALDNWRVGRYDTTTQIFSWLRNYQLLSCPT